MSVPSRDEMAENALLAVLHQEDRARLQPHMLRLDLGVHDILTHAGDDVVDTWFPCGRALAAFCIAGPDGVSVDVAFVGREGAVGGIVSNGDVPAYSTAVVRVEGPFLRIKTSALEAAKIESISLRHCFSRYADCLLAQVFQTAACSAVHTIRQRVAKMILAGLVRSGDREFRMTQEQLADMLGVGRTFVSRTLGTLREEGIIDIGRGMLLVKNEPALRAVSCKCTAAIEDHFDKVLHGIYPLPA